MNKIRSILMACVAAAALLLPGCATNQNATTAQRIAGTAKVAAYVGTAEYLRSHPEARPAFVAARDSLLVLENAETVDLVTLLQIVNRLPVKELSSPNARLIITAATMLLSDYAGTLSVDQLSSLKPVVAGLRQGIDAGLQ